MMMRRWSVSFVLSCAVSAAADRSDFNLDDAAPAGTKPGGGARRTSSLSYRSSLPAVENALITTAKGDFNGHAGAFEAATRWDGEKLRASSEVKNLGEEGQQGEDLRAPHLACVDYENGGETLALLKHLLGPEAVRPVSHSQEQGACFFATASHAEAATILQEWDAHFQLGMFAPFPSALKLAPGLLQHHEDGLNAPGDDGGEMPSVPTNRVRAQHGAPMRRDDVEGLTVELTPGTLTAGSASDADAFIIEMSSDLMSTSLDLHRTNFWSDPSLAEGEHLTTPGGAARGRDWTGAATVVHNLSKAAGTSPGDICSWDSIVIHRAGDDILLVSGLDHLLYAGRGAGGSSHDGEAAELHVACFMGLVSFFAGRAEVIRVSPTYAQRVYDAAARANIQSATVTDTPLTDAGLDGTGQVIQIIDTGLDESSCFFAHDDTGDHVTHGYFFDEWSSENGGTLLFSGGDFTVYPDRRKIIQYINFIKSDGTVGSHGSYATSMWGGEFEYDSVVGHGTHTAGSAAGATLHTPAETVTCASGRVTSCVGGCIDNSWYRTDDDLTEGLGYDIDRICPAFGCDSETDEVCLSDDVSQTLTDNGGMARGAKLAIFDAFYEEAGLAQYAVNGVWETCAEADCKLHSNSWGGDYECQLGPTDIEYDQFMYENPENLLIFAAGNDGDEVRSTCTIGSPGIAKNVLAVGASTSGSTRLSQTENEASSIDTSGIDEIAYFSSRGPTTDYRIKPEVVAPGDMIYSAASDGEENEHSCRLWPMAGTSMSCPIVAGASAMVRQYFMNDTFYAADMQARGFCDDWFGCEAFRPSAATIKALLINSANLMGGDTRPDGDRGFGRVHLEAGMPLAGEGSLALFVADASTTSIPSLTWQELTFDVDATAGLELRATLSWIDPAASSSSSIQLMHDLDLLLVSPSGVWHTMWETGMDVRNVNERVIVDWDEVETGTWSAWVWAEPLLTDEQSYSLVVNGAISPATGTGSRAL